MFVHSLRKKLGAQLSGLFCNEDEDLQRVIDEYCETGITRVELRFEKRSFEPKEYYEQQMDHAYCTLIGSMAARICSVKVQWELVVEQIKDCLLFIEETSGVYYVAWYKNNAYQ